MHDHRGGCGTFGFWNCSVSYLNYSLVNVHLGEKFRSIWIKDFHSHVTFLISEQMTSHCFNTLLYHCKIHVCKCDIKTVSFVLHKI